MEAVSERSAEKTNGRPEGQVRRLAQFLGLAVVSLMCTPLTLAQQGRATAVPPDLQGVYQSVPDRTTLPGGLKNTGSPAAISLLPEAAQQARSIDLKKDPWKMCQPVGPFRMMAKEQTKIELVQVSAMIVMLFEDLSHGMMRTIYLKRGHPAKLEPNWLGDSVGRWEGDALVVDTTGFNDHVAERRRRAAQQRSAPGGADPSSDGWPVPRVQDDGRGPQNAGETV